MLPCSVIVGLHNHPVLKTVGSVFCRGFLIANFLAHDRESDKNNHFSYEAAINRPTWVLKIKLFSCCVPAYLSRRVKSFPGTVKYLLALCFGLCLCAISMRGCCQCQIWQNDDMGLYPFCYTLWRSCYCVVHCLFQTVIVATPLFGIVYCRSRDIMLQLDSCVTSKLTRYRPLWDMTTAGPLRCPVWCCLCGIVYRRKRPGNTQNGGTVLPIANLMADSESGSPDSCSSVLVTIRLSRLVSDIFACDRQTDGQRGPLL